MLRNCLSSSSFLHHFSEITGKYEGQKTILETFGQLIQLIYFLLQKEIYLFYSFSEQAAAKGNSLETSW